MTKLRSAAFTNYFGDVLPVQILSFDNNKYAKIKKPDGSIDEVKAGYIWADAAMTRRVRLVDWHVLGGGSRKTFQKRQRRTTYYVYFEDEPVRRYSSKASALKVASVLATRVRTGDGVAVTSEQVFRLGNNVCYFDCFASGLVLQSKGPKQPVKYLRGYGKVPRSLKQNYQLKLQ